MTAMIELATAKEVCAALKIGRTTLWRWVKEGSFPAPRSIGPNCTRWLLSDVGYFLANARLIPEAGFYETAGNGVEGKNVTKIKPYPKAKNGEGRPRTS